MSGMGPLIGLLVLLAILAAVIKFVLPSLLKPTKGFPYQANPALLSPAERSFLGVLEQAVQGQFRIMAKVRLADIVSVKGGMSRSDWQAAFNRIQSKHVDFVLCNPSDFSITCVVELDDKSHRKSGRPKSSVFER